MTTRHSNTLGALGLLAASALPALGSPPGPEGSAETPLAPGAFVAIVDRAGGLTSPVGVTHAGDDFQNSGHHHLLIDVTEPLDGNEPISQDKSHLHFGAGQTEARIELPPGKHTLQLVLGDAKHYPFNPPLVSNKITIRIR